MASLPLDQNTIIGVDFGPGKTGRTGSVGLTILNADNQQLVARSTASIYEILGTKGAYGLKKSYSSSVFNADAAGYWFVFDTGEADDTKATHVEKVTFFDPAAGGGGGASAGGGSSETSSSSGSRKSVITYDSGTGE